MNVQATVAFVLAELRTLEGEISHRLLLFLRFIFRSVSANLARCPVLPFFFASALNFACGIFCPFFTPAVFRSAPGFLIAFWMNFFFLRLVRFLLLVFRVATHVTVLSFVVLAFFQRLLLVVSVTYRISLFQFS
jgi:hypothetical protein